MSEFDDSNEDRFENSLDNPYCPHDGEMMEVTDFYIYDVIPARGPYVVYEITVFTCPKCGSTECEQTPIR